MAIKKSNKKEKRKRRIIAITTTVAFFVVTMGVGLRFYNDLTSPSVFTSDGNDAEIYIPTGSTFEQVKDTLVANLTIKNIDAFAFLAEHKDYPAKIHPGHYVIKNKTSYNQLVNILKGGLQTPVRVTFNNLRDVNQLAGRVSRKIEADSASIAFLLHKNDFVDSLGFSSISIPTMFLPNTYEFYWNTDAKSFITRMKQEYDTFWNKERKTKASNIGFSPTEVSILASIVDKETSKTDEMPTIAGVYINRLLEGMPLQADPTLIYILNDPGIHRVLNQHKSLKSPYNTYSNIGLPPGPICIPSIAAIEAVLNYKKHKYLYFCAKEDFSGYHNFAKTLSEHNRNAAKYQRELNNRNIFK